jgi:pyridinium-3,5-biscarboxylic acid mononucleotide synthase
MDVRRFQGTLREMQRKNRLLAVKELARFAMLDIGRQVRKGIPEIILAEGKAPKDVAEIARAMVEKTGRAIVSRADKTCLKLVRSKARHGWSINYSSRSKIILVKSKSFKIRPSGGRVGILTAGTSDIPVAMEAEVVVREMGSQTRSYYDVGVAGLHRLFEPLKELLTWDSDVILVVAGREGALPTVVAGIVDVPVVGVPTSKSYGFGEKGLAALAAMLQSCSLGMSVVNIDGGVGAGAVAAMIANRMGQARKHGTGRSFQ